MSDTSDEMQSKNLHSGGRRGGYWVKKNKNKEEEEQRNLHVASQFGEKVKHNLC